MCGVCLDVFFVNDVLCEVLMLLCWLKLLNEMKLFEVKCMLLCEYFYDVLYVLNKGYFINDCKMSVFVGMMDEGVIDFKALRG